MFFFLSEHNGVHNLSIYIDEPYLNFHILCCITTTNTLFSKMLFRTSLHLRWQHWIAEWWQLPLLFFFMQLLKCLNFLVRPCTETVWDSKGHVVVMNKTVKNLNHLNQTTESLIRVICECTAFTHESTHFFRHKMFWMKCQSIIVWLKINYPH